MRFIKQFGAPEKPGFNKLKEFWLPLAPSLVAVAAILSQMVNSGLNLQLQREQIQQQINLKEYEAEL